MSLNEFIYLYLLKLLSFDKIRTEYVLNSVLIPSGIIISLKDELDLAEKRGDIICEVEGEITKYYLTKQGESKVSHIDSHEMIDCAISFELNLEKVQVFLKK